MTILCMMPLVEIKDQEKVHGHNLSAPYGWFQRFSKSDKHNTNSSPRKHSIYMRSSNSEFSASDGVHLLICAGVTPGQSKLSNKISSDAQNQTTRSGGLCAVLRHLLACKQLKWKVLAASFIGNRRPLFSGQTRAKQLIWLSRFGTDEIQYVG